MILLTERTNERQISYIGYVDTIQYNSLTCTITFDNTFRTPCLNGLMDIVTALYTGQPTALLHYTRPSSVVNLKRICRHNAPPQLDSCNAKSITVGLHGRVKSRCSVCVCICDFLAEWSSNLDKNNALKERLGHTC